MALDILGALRRAVTLPKSRNSVADVLGPDGADYLRALVLPVAEQVANSAALAYADAGGTLADLAFDATARLSSHAERIMGRPLAQQIRREMERSISEALARAVPTPTQMRAAIVAGILGALKL